MMRRYRVLPHQTLPPEQLLRKDKGRIAMRPLFFYFLRRPLV
jgi:hypothetical protein